MSESYCKSIENQCDPEIGVLVGDESSNQLLISNSFSIPLELSGQNNWSVWMLRQLLCGTGHLSILFCER
jgi:hypothetical protein